MHKWTKRTDTFHLHRNIMSKKKQQQQQQLKEGLGVELRSIKVKNKRGVGRVEEALKYKEEWEVGGRGQEKNYLFSVVCIMT